MSIACSIHVTHFEKKWNLRGPLQNWTMGLWWLCQWNSFTLWCGYFLCGHPLVALMLSFLMLFLHVWSYSLVQTICDCEWFMIHLPHPVHQETHDLKVFVVVMPKEGWAHVAAPIHLLAWHRLFENIIYDVSRVKFWKVSVILVPKVSYHACPSFFWYDNDRDLKVCFLLTSVTYEINMGLGHFTDRWMDNV